MSSSDAPETMAQENVAKDVSNANEQPKKKKGRKLREKAKRGEYNTCMHGGVYSGGPTSTRQVVNLTVEGSPGGSWLMKINRSSVGVLSEGDVLAYVQGGKVPLPDGCSMGEKLKDNRDSVISYAGGVLNVGFFYMEELRNDVGKLLGVDAVSAPEKKRKWKRIKSA